ncbi:hypothetical protein WMF18_09590 [Sorangium sp. So ce315]|uniref:hypothetical protein n=1 Tax=Sorangium sp. So ce315 TaxID=3133299 RepID=UPI003F622EAB
MSKQVSASVRPKRARIIATASSTKFTVRSTSEPILTLIELPRATSARNAAANAPIRSASSHQAKKYGPGFILGSPS